MLAVLPQYLCAFMKNPLSRSLTTLLLSTLAPIALAADDTELAKKSQNPIASLISVPFENNFNFNAGPEDGTEWVMNAKPVYPVSFEGFNLINRVIAPVVYQEERFDGEGSEFGLGNVTYQAFIAPETSSGLIWGVGPALTLPTNTDSRFGPDKWSLGPAAVALKISGPWVVGALLQHSWSFAGDSDDNNVNLTSLQYFVNYNFGNSWYLTSTPTMTANWDASSSDRYTIPVGGGIGRLVRFGQAPVDFRLRAFYNVEKPDNASNWTAQFEVKFLFPKGS